MTEEVINAADEVTARPDEAALTIQVRPTLASLIKGTAAMSRRGIFANAFGGYSLGWALLGVFFGIPILAWLPAALFAAALLSGYYCAPLIWFVVMRRRDLALAPASFTFGPEGVDYRSAKINGRNDWSVYRRARDLGSAIVLEASPAAANLLPTADLASSTRTNLLAILASHGLIRRATTVEMAKPFIAVGAGLSAAIVQLYTGIGI